MSACCSETGCRRKKPMMLMRGGLTGTWYVVTDYEDRGEDRFYAKTKHALAPKQQAELEEMRAACEERAAHAPCASCGKTTPLIEMVECPDELGRGSPLRYCEDCYQP